MNNYLPFYKKLGLMPTNEKLKQFGRILNIAPNDIFYEIAFEQGFLKKEEADVFEKNIKELDNYDEIFLEKYSSTVINELILQSDESNEGFINHFINEIERFKERKKKEKINITNFSNILDLIKEQNYIAAQREIKNSSLPGIDKSILNDVYQLSIDETAATTDFSKVIEKTNFFNWLSFNAFSDKYYS